MQLKRPRIFEYIKISLFKSRQIAQPLKIEGRNPFHMSPAEETYPENPMGKDT
jgi:hypothetical protein